MCQLPAFVHYQMENGCVFNYTHMHKNWKYTLHLIRHVDQHLAAWFELLNLCVSCYSFILTIDNGAFYMRNLANVSNTLGLLHNIACPFINTLQDFSVTP